MSDPGHRDNDLVDGLKRDLGKIVFGSAMTAQVSQCGTDE